LYWAPLCAVWLYVKSPCSFISYNFNYCLELNNAVKHINWGLMAPGPIFCPSGRTINTGWFTWEATHHPSNYQLEGTPFLSICLFFIYGDSQFFTLCEWDQEMEGWIVPSTQDLNQLLSSTI
jgi:hypothetical protein